MMLALLLPIAARAKPYQQTPPANSQAVDVEEMKRFSREGVKAYADQDYEKAVSLLQAGLQKAEALKVRTLKKEGLIASFCVMLGGAYNSRGKYKEGLPYAQRALGIGAKNGDEAIIAHAKNELGNLEYNLGHYAQALNYRQDVMAFRRKVNDSHTLADSLNNLGISYDQQGEFDAALKCYNEALDIYMQSETKVDAAETLDNIGNVYDEMGQFAKALEAHKTSVQQAREAKNKSVLAASLNDMGNTYDEMGMPQDALNCFHEALILQRALKNLPRVAITLHNIGGIYLSLNQYITALKNFDEALDLREAAGNAIEMVDTRISLGDVYVNLGYLDRANAQYQQALKVYERYSEKGGQANAFIGLGNIAARRRQFPEALQRLEKALALIRQLPDQTSLIQTLISLAAVSCDAANYAQSLHYTDEALRIAEKAGNSQLLALVLNNRGAAYQKSGQFAQALACHERLLDYRQKLNNSWDISVSLMNCAGLCEKQNDFARAEKYLAEALARLENQSEQVGDAEKLGDFQEPYYKIYAQYAELLVAMQRPEDALAVLERGRGQGLARQAAQNVADTFLSAADLQQWQDANQKVNDARSALARLQQQVPPARKTQHYNDGAGRSKSQQQIQPASETGKKQQEIQIEEARSKLESAERKLTLLRADFYQRYPAFRRLHGAEPPAFPQMQSLAQKNPDTLYLEYAFRADQGLLLFTLSAKDGLRAVEIPIAEMDITAKVNRWRSAITAWPDLSQRQLALSEPKEAKALGQILFGPLAEAGLLAPGRFARIVVVAEGALLDAPFAALLLQDNKRLIERYALSSCISLGALMWPASSRQPTASLLCAADPLGDENKLLESASRGRLGGLRGARREGIEIAKMAPGAVLYLGKRALKAEIVAKAPQFAMLHFATHGLLDAQDGLRSAIVFAPAAPDSNQYDVLEAYDIIKLPLTAQIAVLSACSSARGQKSGGEGLLGMAWAFQAAGCPSIMASSWGANDAQTETLMTHFYAGLLTGKRKDKALQEAVLSVMNAGKQKTSLQYRPPYYWAAFQLIGNTAAVHLSGIRKP